MAQKQGQRKKGQTRGKAGKPATSEPKVQIFQKFGGCNFQLSPRDFDYTMDDEAEQTDLLMNFVVVQNNVALAPNSTFETRQNLKTLFTAPEGTTFTDVATLFKGEFYIATDDKQIQYGNLDEGFKGTVEISDIDGEERDNTWTYLGYADDKLVGMTKGLQLWTGPIGTHVLENAKKIPTPDALAFSQLKANGSLTVSSSIDAAHPFRISLRYTLINKYGPTLPSPPLTFFASKPTTEWSGSAFLTVSGTAPTGYAIQAVELYYTEDEYQDPSFLSRVDLAAPRDGGAWFYNWIGYLFDTSMWTVANLTMPTENYTSGVPASKMIQHDGRLYFWGNNEKPERLYIGGNPGNIFSISTGVGGGFADCEPGSGQAIRMVPKFKTQSGNAIVTILCDNPNSSKENRFNLLENNITLSNEQSTKGWQTEKISGTVGVKSYHGAGAWADGLYAVSRYGLALTTLAMEYNSQLQVTYVSDPIEPVFLDQYGNQLTKSVLLCVNDIIYMTFGAPNGNLDNVLFCYDIQLKAWWTYTLDVKEPILNMINIDHENNQEGIGIITSRHVYLLPTTRLMDLDTVPSFDFLIETGELSTTMPMQPTSYLSQLEFRFDYFIGDMRIQLIGIDHFGRRVKTVKKIHHSKLMHGLTEYMRVDLVLESYKIIFDGQANFRMTHFLSKVYPKSNKIGMVWGFDDRQSYREENDIHPYFKSYNDLREAIIP